MGEGTVRNRPSGRKSWHSYEVTATIWFRILDDDGLADGRAKLLAERSIEIIASVPLEITKIQAGKIYKRKDTPKFSVAVAGK